MAIRSSRLVEIVTLRHRAGDIVNGSAKIQYYMRAHCAACRARAPHAIRRPSHEQCRHLPSAAPRDEPRRGLSNLLLFVAGLVFAMVVVGGITRLTESGLSITEWKPITGAIPPLTHADWVTPSISTGKRRNIARLPDPRE